jgi:hypothetical protein
MIPWTLSIFFSRGGPDSVIALHISWTPLNILFNANGSDRMDHDDAPKISQLLSGSYKEAVGWHKN